MILVVSLISGGAALLVIGSCVMSNFSRFNRCPDCASIWNRLGYVIKYTGYAAKFRSSHLHDDAYPSERCPQCQLTQNAKYHTK